MPLSTPDLVGGARAAAGQYQSEIGAVSCFFRLLQATAAQYPALRHAGNMPSFTESAERLDGLVEPRQGQGIHAPLEQPADELDRAVVPPARPAAAGLIQANFG